MIALKFVNAFLMAIVVTLIVLLDYLWPQIKSTLKEGSRKTRVKYVVIGSLLLFAWIQAGIQFCRDSESDRNMRYLKDQLANANRSLTNSTEVVRGLTTGGDSTAEFNCGMNEQTNILDFDMQTGDYPLRALYVKVTDKTDRVNRNRSLTNPPPKDSILFERYFGDVPGKAFQRICSAKLNPAVTNYIQFDVSALNGSYWQVWAITKSNDAWAIKLNYRWSQIGGKFQIDPPAMRNTIMVDD